MRKGDRDLGVSFETQDKAYPSSPSRRRTSTKWMPAALTCGLVLSLEGLAVAGLTVGCRSEHRIRLSEFLEMQQAMSAAPAEEVEEQPAVTVDQHLGPYKVGPGDVLTVTLTGTQPGLLPPVVARVDRNGSIDLPVVGAVAVGDMELEDIEDRIRQAYVPRVYAEAVAHVELTTADPTNVLVVGAVTVPGLVHLRRTERNMLFAIVGAGGVSAEASGHATLRRIRRPNEAATYDLTDPTQLKVALALDPLESGDIVSVPAAQPNTVFVGGLVNRASPQIYPPGTKITALQALAAANGVRTDIFPKEGTLVRRMPDGKDVHVKLDLNRIARGDDPNIVLAAGDILWIPETWDTRVEEFINRNIFLRAGVSVNYNVTGIEFMNRRSLQTSNRGSTGTLQDRFDPLGFLSQPTATQSLGSSPSP